MEHWDLRAENAVTNQKKGAGAISALKRRRGEKVPGAGEHAFAGTQMKLMTAAEGGERERSSIVWNRDFNLCLGHSVAHCGLSAARSTAHTCVGPSSWMAWPLPTYCQGLS